MSGIEQVATVGEGTRPSSNRIEITTMDAHSPGFQDDETHFVLLPADLVFDRKLLEDPGVPGVPGVPGDDMPLRILPIGDFPDVAQSPQKWLREMGTGSAESGSSFAIRVTDRNSRRRAERSLLLSMRKPLDGIVSRNLNRHISLFVSRILIKLGVVPNHLTSAVMLIGVSAAVAAAMADHWWMLLLAGFLFQTQSVLDGCDGEIARLTYQFSKMGQWLDTIGDDITNYFFYLGIAIGQARVLGVSEFYYVGGITFLAQWGLSFIMYQRIIKMGTGDLLAIPDTLTKDGPSKPGPAGAIMRFLRVISKRDFFVLLVATLTAAQQPIAAFIIMTVGTYPTLLAVAVNEWRLRKMERAGQSTSPE